MSKKNKVNPVAIVLLVPLLIMFFMYFIYPLFYVVILSFYSWTGYSDRVFVGFNNFIQLFKSDTFWTSLKNNLAWMFSLGLVQIFFALLTALILARKPRFWKTFRTVYFVPKVISTVAIAMLWQAIYNAEYGVLNSLLTSMTGKPVTQNWLGSYETALLSLIIPQVLYIGYFMVIILAGIMNIPESYYEAATIDGASVFRQEIHITIPLIWGTLVTAMTLAMAYGMRQFEMTFLMTGGGPGHSTSVLGLLMYKKIGQTRLGEAASIGVILVITGFIIVSGLRKLLKREEYEKI